MSSVLMAWNITLPIDVIISLVCDVRDNIGNRPRPQNPSRFFPSVLILTFSFTLLCLPFTLLLYFHASHQLFLQCFRIVFLPKFVFFSPHSYCHFSQTFTCHFSSYVRLLSRTLTINFH